MYSTNIVVGTYGRQVVIRYKSDLAFVASASINNCCGITELSGFRFLWPSEDAPEGFGEAFQEAIRKLGENFRKGIVHLTLHQYDKDGPPVQPAWFVNALKAYPNAISGPFIKNPNSGNYIQMWMLPTNTAYTPLK